MATPSTVRIPEPLRLPRGSVRGVIALIVTATYAYLLIQGRPVPAVLINSVVVVIAFYFGSRAAAMHLPTPQGAPGLPTPPALPSTPRRTQVARALVFLGLVGLAAWFLRANPTWNGIPPELQAVLEVLGGYVSGLTVSWLVHRRAHQSDLRRRLATIARDIIAAAALALSAYICFALVAQIATVFADRAEDALSLVVTFYFGSRVIGH